VGKREAQPLHCTAKRKIPSLLEEEIKKSRSGILGTVLEGPSENKQTSWDEGVRAPIPDVFLLPEGATLRLRGTGGEGAIRKKHWCNIFPSSKS